MTVLIGYVILMNVIAFVSMGLDKSKAKRGKWRIPESTLMIQAALGGSIGAYAGMHCFRHKTKHTKFVIGVPLILFFHGILAGVVVYLKIKKII